jgi:hypothetical protein
MTNDPEIIRVVAKKLLNLDGQADVEVYLVDEGPKTAVWYLRGAIDGRLEARNITRAEAESLYRELGVTAEDAKDLLKKPN